MINVLFVCHGNICRSPMAQIIMQDLIDKKGLSDKVTVTSVAASREEIGRDIYPPVRALLRQNGFTCPKHAAVQIQRSDYEKYTYIVCMDHRNLRELAFFFPSDPAGKICRLMEFTNTPEDVEDPWYTDDFDTVYKQILKGCSEMLEHLRDTHGI